MTPSNAPDANVTVGQTPPNRRRRAFGIASLREHTARGMLLNSGFELALAGLGALRGIIVAAFLTRADYGIWGLLGFTMWTALGLKNQFGAGDKYVQQSEENQQLAFQRAFTVELIFTVAAAPVAAALVVAFALFTGHTVVLAPGLLLVLMLPATALQFPVSVFYRRLDYLRQRRLQAIDPASATVVTVLLAILGAGYWSFVAGALFGSWAGAIVAVRASPYPLAFRYDWTTLRSYVGFSAPLLVGGLAGIGMFQVIYLAGNGAFGLAGLGAMTLAGNFVQFTDQADAVVTQTLYPAICMVRDRVALLSEIFVKSNRLSLMWAVPFGVGLTLFAPDLFRFVIGARWLPAVPLVEILGIVTALNHMGYNWAAFYMARGDTRPIAVLGVLSAATVVGFGVPLMYSDGVAGLGWAFALGAAVALVGRGILLARLFQGFRLIRHMLRALVPTVVAAVPILVLRAALGDERSLPAAGGVFALYVACTVVATVVLERPLLTEAVGYMLRQRRDPELGTP
jgi:O-antigen/teichoic acid export membrane protein